VSSTDEGRDLGSLSAEESQKYCKDIASYNNTTLDQEEAKKVSCSIVALLTLSLAGGTSNAAQQSCQGAFFNCINKPTDTTPKEIDCTNTRLNTCKGVKVGDYDQCVREQIGLARLTYTNFASLSAEQICTPRPAGAGGAAGSTSTTSNNVPPSCVPIEAKGPQLFDSSSTTNSGGGAGGGSNSGGAAGSGAGGAAGSGAGGSKAGAAGSAGK
jgi:uncharacterized membrane protein YgcG